VRDVERDGTLFLYGDRNRYGRLATLLSVLEFYGLGDGQTPNAEIDPRAVGASISGGATGRANVIDFLADGLTDCRVEHELAPFDHPALSLPNGTPLPAVGARGDGTACP